MTVNKDDFYLKDISLLKQLEPIMARKGIEADKWRCGAYYNILVDEDVKNEHWLEAGLNPVPTWRKDSLEAALPDWCFKTSGIPTQSKPMSSETALKVYDLKQVITFRGQASLKALAELIILLDKEGIL